jgi:hypothetical protein
MHAFALVCFGLSALAPLGCRDNGDGNGPGTGGNGSPDLAVSTPSGGGPDLAMPGSGTDGSVPKSYTKTTIAAMRQGKPGDYELDGVIVLGVTQQSSPKLVVQDAAGKDFSAILGSCSSSATSKYPCSAAAMITALKPGESVTLQGTYIKSSAVAPSTAPFEEFHIATFADNGAGTLPTPLALTVDDVKKGATKSANYYQRFSITLAQSLVLYDLTPSEFVAMYNGKPETQCPFMNGFAVIPQGAAAAAPADCSGTGATATQPTPIATPNAAEILIGTDFHGTSAAPASGFDFSADCRCTTKFKTKQLAPTSAVSGTLSGIVMLGSTGPGTPVFTYVAPQTEADASFTGATQK